MINGNTRIEGLDYDIDIDRTERLYIKDQTEKGTAFKTSTKVRWSQQGQFNRISRKQELFDTDNS